MKSFICLIFSSLLCCSFLYSGNAWAIEPFHVSKAAFEETVRIANNAGFSPVERPKVFLSKTVILKTSKTKRRI